ncbi:uncharacterized protein [Macrobrachium rosenbergii]|uniref:uncharacterized protein n=1 Tax=Macrobrachium rosenbergii TaxID=79674 RepID=UPI0034D48D7B
MLNMHAASMPNKKSALARKRSSLLVLPQFILSSASFDPVIGDVLEETPLTRSKRCYPVDWASQGSYQSYRNWCQPYYPCYPYPYNPCWGYYSYGSTSQPPNVTTQQPRPTHAPTSPWPTYIVPPATTRPPYIPVGPTTRPPYIPVGPTTRPPYIPVGPTTRPPYIPVGPTTRPPYIPVGPTTRPPYIPVGPTTRPPYIPVGPTTRPPYIPVGPTTRPPYIPVGPTTRPPYIPVGPTTRPPYIPVGPITRPPFIPVGPTTRPPYIPVGPITRLPFIPITRPPYIPVGPTTRAPFKPITRPPYIPVGPTRVPYVLDPTDKTGEDEIEDTTEELGLVTESPSSADNETDTVAVIFPTDLPIIVDTIPIPENDIVPDVFPTLPTRPLPPTKPPKDKRVRYNATWIISDDPDSGSGSSHRGCKTICVDGETQATYCCDNKKRECPVYELSTCSKHLSSGYHLAKWCIFDSQCPEDSKCCYNDCRGDYQCETVGKENDKVLLDASDIYHNDRPHRHTQEQQTAKEHLGLTAVFPVRGNRSRTVLDQYIEPVAGAFENYLRVTLLPIVAQTGDAEEQVIADALGQVIQCASKYYSDQRAIVTLATCLMKSPFTELRVKPTDAIGATRKCDRMAGQRWKLVFKCITEGEGQHLFATARASHRQTLDSLQHALSSTAVLDVPILVLNETVLDTYWVISSQDWLPRKICQQLLNKNEEHPVCDKLTG